MSNLNYIFIISFLVSFVRFGFSSSSSSESNSPAEECSSSIEGQEPKEKYGFTFSHSEAEEKIKPAASDPTLDDGSEASDFLAMLILKHLNINKPGKFEDELEEILISSKYRGELKELLVSRPIEGGTNFEGSFLLSWCIFLCRSYSKKLGRFGFLNYKGHSWLPSIFP